jgi:hypothetical protein
MARDLGGAISCPKRFNHTIRVASLALMTRIQLNIRVCYQNCICCCDASNDSRICWAGSLVTPSKCDGDSGKRDLENKQIQLCGKANTSSSS